jgi:hypothetical protein
MKIQKENETQRFLRHVKIAIEQSLGTKLKVRELTEKGKRKK